MNDHIPQQYQEAYERSLKLYSEIKKEPVHEVHKGKDTRYYSRPLGWPIYRIVYFQSYKEHSWRSNILTAIYLPLNVERAELHISNTDYWEPDLGADSFDINLKDTIKPLIEILKKSKEFPNRDKDLILSLSKDKRFGIKDDDVHFSEDIVQIDGILYERVVPVHPLLIAKYRLTVVPKNVRIGYEEVVLTVKFDKSIKENEYTFVVNSKPPRTIVVKDYICNVVPSSHLS